MDLFSLLLQGLWVVPLAYFLSRSFVSLVNGWDTEYHRQQGTTHKFIKRLTIVLGIVIAGMLYFAYKTDLHILRTIWLLVLLPIYTICELIDEPFHAGPKAKPFSGSWWVWVLASNGIATFVGSLLLNWVALETSATADSSFFWFYWLAGLTGTLVADIVAPYGRQRKGA